jgi:hypothetical protein
VSADSPDGSSIASSSDSSAGATLLCSLAKPLAARCSSMNRSAAVAQDLACAEGTQGGYWNSLDAVVSTGLPSSTVVTLQGKFSQVPSESTISPSRPHISLAHRSISWSSGWDLYRPWSWNQMVTWYMSTFCVSKGNHSRRQFPIGKPRHSINAA